jgi:hypothetical protein
LPGAKSIAAAMPSPELKGLEVRHRPRRRAVTRQLPKMCKASWRAPDRRIFVMTHAIFTLLRHRLFPTCSRQPGVSP